MFKKTLAINGFTISALSCHGNPLHPDADAREARPGSQPQDHPAGREARRPGGGRFLRLPRRFAERQVSQLGHLPWPPDYLEICCNWQWDEVVTPYWRNTPSSPPITA